MTASSMAYGIAHQRKQQLSAEAASRHQYQKIIIKTRAGGAASKSDRRRRVAQIITRQLAIAMATRV